MSGTVKFFCCIFSLIVAVLSIAPASHDVLAADKAANHAIDFSRDIAPIFTAHCIGCHHAENSKGDLSLSTVSNLLEYGYVVAGNPGDSELLAIVTHDGDRPPRMPKDGTPLSSQQVELLRRWIAAGAEWPDEMVLRPRPKADANWWSLQPIADTKPPAAGPSKHPIDRFIDARLRESGLRRAPPADRRTLIRRVYFDLIGLPPAPQRVAAFVADDDPQAYEHLVDELLDSEHFGERWARHWLDIAHYADTHGFERDKRRDNAWRYRDYVIRSFNDDKPYDQFLLEQIAGDVLAPDDPQAVMGTGFLAAGPWDFVGQVETKSPVLRRAARALDLDDMVTQVITATIGMTVNCARCHDHKLDPITQQEYYRLVAVFAGLRRDNRIVSESASRQYEGEKKRLDEALGRVSFQIGELQGRAVDLADVVGGGNGFGSGRRGIGLDPRTGKIQERPFGDLGNVRPGNFSDCEYPFVDGVFVPAEGETKISSTGLIARTLPANSGKAWDMIRYGPVASQFSTEWGGVDYNTGGHSMIGLHANAGITFDLAAIRQTSQTLSEMTFTTVVGYGGRLVEPSAEFRVIVDGQLKAQGRLGRNDVARLSIPLSADARFLTLVSTDGGNGYSHDQISFGDPRLTSAEPPNLTDSQRRRLAALRTELQQLEAERRALGEPPEFYGVVPEQPPIVHVLSRGNPETPGEAVQPGTLAFGHPSHVFGTNEMPESGRRLALAQWIVDPKNPLTRRVIVNRLWHWHFGQGLVTTPSDFGFGGGRPSHPELLDWLADELLRANWSLKHIHRLIVTSQAYRMRSHLGRETLGGDSTDPFAQPAADATADPVAVDADNRLLWRMNPRRLEAEAVRDAVLAVTGKLNREMYGPGYRDFDYEEAYAPIYTYKTADSPELWRRSVYRFIVRTTPSQFMTTLDCPDPANLTPKRNVTTTALQSLALYNNDFMLRQSRYFAERLEREAGTDTAAQIDLAFQLAFGRLPDESEQTLARRLVETHGTLHFCRAIFNANEFIYID